jgi:hypothetical protein
VVVERGRDATEDAIALSSIQLEVSHELVQLDGVDCCGFDASECVGR